jgi:small subunit ribosomal protein S17
MKIFTGHVVSTKMAKTATVSVERVVIHPLYKKRFKRDQKYPVHDEIGVKIGDLVKFTACKPYSKTKKWKILEVVGAKKATVKKVAEKVVEKKAVVKKEKGTK